MPPRRPRALLVAGSLTILAAASWPGLGLPVQPVKAASSLPPGFVDETLVTGLELPTVMAIAADGRVFVGEKSGIVKTWPSYGAFATDDAPAIAADLTNKVMDYWDRGLMGLAVDPDYPASPYLYAFYTLDAPPGEEPPFWNDDCPAPKDGGPGPLIDGCPARNRLERLTLDPTTGVMTGRKTLVTGWCQQFPSHTAGTLAFGIDGALYVSAGDGASFHLRAPRDYGQYGGTKPSTRHPVTQADPCGDPVDPAYLPHGAKRGSGYDADAEGGALRAQSFRRTDGPVVLNAALLRLDKTTGEGAAGNPASASADANARRIAAYGFRNPFRFTIRPGTNDVWVGNVGYNLWDAIDEVPDPTSSAGPLNFGWPCREGTSTNTYYAPWVMTACTTLNPASVTGPTFEYAENQPTVRGDACGVEGSSLSGLAFYEGTTYPAAYRHALFFADYTRACLSLLQAGPDGRPDPTKPLAFGSAMGNPIQLLTDPNGDLLYVDYDASGPKAGSIHRIRYAAATPSAPPGPSPMASPAGGGATEGPSPALIGVGVVALGGSVTVILGLLLARRQRGSTGTG